MSEKKSEDPLGNALFGILEMAASGNLLGQILAASLIKEGVLKEETINEVKEIMYKAYLERPDSEPSQEGIVEKTESALEEVLKYATKGK